MPTSHILECNFNSITFIKFHFFFFLMFPVLDLRIVAARLNGSLDFFTVEINKPLALLQYRGEKQPLYSEADT